MSYLSCRQLESALTIDAVTVIVAGLTEQVRTNKVAVGKVFRRGQVFNHDLPGISCDDHQSRPWVLGEDIMKSLLKARHVVIVVAVAVAVAIAVAVAAAVAL